MKKEEFLKTVQETYDKRNLSPDQKIPLDISTSMWMLYEKCMKQLEIMEFEFKELLEKWGEPVQNHIKFANASMSMDVLLTLIQTKGLFDAIEQDPNDPAIIVGLEAAKSKLLECHAMESHLFPPIGY